MQYISVYLDKEKSAENMLMSTELKVCAAWLIYFLDLL